MYSISGTCRPAVTTFASSVHLTWMQSNMQFDLLFRVTGSQNVRIKFWDNQGGTSRNRCTQRLVILHAQTVMTHYRTLIEHRKLRHLDLLYSSKSLTDKTGRQWTFASQLSLTIRWLFVIGTQCSTSYHATFSFEV